MSVIVSDTGFAADDFAGTTVDLAPDSAASTLAALVTQAPDMIRIAFPGFADGRGFTLARLLRIHGYRGRLRATGHVLADQYAMARRAGFDEVEIDSTLAARQPEDQWRARADWRDFDHQAALRG